METRGSMACVLIPDVCVCVFVVDADNHDKHSEGTI